MSNLLVPSVNRSRCEEVVTGRGAFGGVLTPVRSSQHILLLVRRLTLHLHCPGR